MSVAPTESAPGEQGKVFPWGSNNPTRRQRIVVALGVAAVAMAAVAWQAHFGGQGRTDFAMIWFGARAMLAGSNPYELVGPGLPFHWGFPLLYPGTALILGIPFAWLSETAAAVTFVGVSAFLFSYGITHRSWHLLPLLASHAFVQSVVAAQWSLIFTAALFLPCLAALVAVKPQSGVPVLATTSARGLKAAAIGSLALLIISLVLMPSWPMDWLTLVRAPTDHMRPRLVAMGGFLVLLLLTRWRRPEAWLIITLACLPQTLASYSLLMLLTVASTFRQAAALAMISTLGSAADPYLVPAAPTAEELYGLLANVEVATAYLPATLLVLRRPNSGDGPAWLTGLRLLFARIRGARSHAP
jgi:hypothetical protein